MTTVLTVVGNRPQFIKSALVSRAWSAVGVTEVLVHTGQHHDADMSEIFFTELDLCPPDYNLGVTGGDHAYQTGAVLQQLAPILQTVAPDVVLVYGDTHATLSGALAAAQLHIPVAHVEAGLRSFNRQMPEEINRVMVDHLATWCFAPTQTAVNNLAQEGITRGVTWVGDVTLDTLQHFLPQARARAADCLDRHGVTPGAYGVLTMHRAETTAQPAAVAKMLQTLEDLDMPVLFPVHPRIQPLVTALGPFSNIRCLPPLGYLDMLSVLMHAHTMITDSGGLQKEAMLLGVPCITLREETEWVETVDHGWNQLVGLCPERFNAAWRHQPTPQPVRHLFGDGTASQQIVQRLVEAKPVLSAFS